MGDFVKVENTSTQVTDTHIVVTVEYLNGTKCQSKISKEVLLIALKKLNNNVRNKNILLESRKS